MGRTGETSILKVILRDEMSKGKIFFLIFDGGVISGWKWAEPALAGFGPLYILFFCANCHIWSVLALRMELTLLPGTERPVLDKEGDVTVAEP